LKEKLQGARAIALVKGYPKHEHEAESDAPSTPISTAVSLERLLAINAHLATIPGDFTIDPKVEKGVVNPRRDALDGGRKILWAHAELLAFGAVLEDSVAVRLSGQDSQRGTFTQRQMVWHDIQNGKRYNGLKTLPTAKASMAAYNSPLSETAVLGFEYGYSVHASNTLVLWEAQFGDFANGAQVIIDQFIASGKVKWDQNPSVVLLLPHGYEGQGPEHSSARIERFLLLCAAENMTVANCSTAAQYFHLLRRQAASLKNEPKPLIIFTPKSLLRHGRAAATVSELSEGSFLPVIDDVRDASRKASVTRLVLCSGKVYHDLVYGPAPEYAERFEYSQESGIAIARVEQLYPFPSVEIADLIATYPNLQEVVWLQEEPQNMGAWSFIAPRLSALLPESVRLKYIGRPDEASPAAGSITAHNAEQFRILQDAFQSIPNIFQSIPSVPNSPSAAVTAKAGARKRA
jgi:2-oxoglutarate dehydrogenase E1 component